MSASEQEPVIKFNEPVPKDSCAQKTMVGKSYSNSSQSPSSDEKSVGSNSVIKFANVGSSVI